MASSDIRSAIVGIAGSYRADARSVPGGHEPLVSDRRADVARIFLPGRDVARTRVGFFIRDQAEKMTDAIETRP